MHAQPLLQLFLFLSATSSAAPLNANNLAKRDDLVPANEAGLANLPGAENLSAIKTLPIAGGLVQRRQLQGAETYGASEPQPEDGEESDSDDEEDGLSDAGSESDSDSEAGDDDEEEGAEQPSSTSTDGPVNPPFALPPALETPAAAVGGGGVESAAEGVAGGATDAVQPQPSGGSLLNVAASVNL
ncbi:hypothetical protein SLS54_008644 [Diplodia seriata]